MSTLLIMWVILTDIRIELKSLTDNTLSYKYIHICSYISTHKYKYACIYIYTCVICSILSGWIQICIYKLLKTSSSHNLPTPRGSKEWSCTVHLYCNSIRLNYNQEELQIDHSYNPLGVARLREDEVFLNSHCRVKLGAFEVSKLWHWRVGIRGFQIGLKKRVSC